MEIKVSVENVDLSSVVGEHYVEDGSDDGYSREQQTLGQAIAAKIALDLKRDKRYGDLERRVYQLRDEEIREQIAPVIAAAITGPVQRTDGYGSPIGKPVSLTEVIVKEVHDYLQRRDGYGSDRPTLVQKFIAEAVERAIKTELAAAIIDEKAKVVAAVRAKAAELIATAVKEGIGR